MTAYTHPPMVNSLKERDWKYGSFAPLIATDIDELHALAKKIGLKPGWFGHAGIPHYKMTLVKQKQAVRNGAIVLQFEDFRKQAAKIVAQQKENEMAHVYCKTCGNNKVAHSGLNCVVCSGTVKDTMSRPVEKSAAPRAPRAPVAPRPKPTTDK